MNRLRLLLGACAAGAVIAIGGAAAAAPGGPPQGTQSDAQFAASNAAVSNVDVTAQLRSCYRPEVLYLDGLLASDGYPGGGGTRCTDGTTTGESVGPYDTQDAAGQANPPLVVKDHSESDIRVDPNNPNHLIGQSKWVVNAEGYNHLLGFYESLDGGATWPTQGHVPGYEGWTDNTDPVGAFDPYGNFYSLVLAYNFYYDKSGGHKYDNGSHQVNPANPPEAVAVSVRPSGAAGPDDWITKRDGHPDYVATAKNANTSDPDKQWIAIDTNPSSPCYGTVYAMWTIFVINPSYLYVSTAEAYPNGTHSDWSTQHVLPTTNGKPWDSYLLPHIAPDGTVYTTITNNPQKQGFSSAEISLISSSDCGRTWNGPLPVVQGVSLPTYRNTTFREGIVNTFAVGNQPVPGSDPVVYPLYVAYEDGSSGGSNVYLTASYDDGHTWTTPFEVNDNPATDDTEALQPNLGVAPSGTVSVAFYDRRLPCPEMGPEATAAGLGYDPKQPYGAHDYCVNAAIQSYASSLAPIGHNVRLSAHTWDPQLSAPHPGCICSSGTFLGDYFGIDSGGGSTYTTSISTFDDGSNPNHYQQQIVSTIATP
jgi:hypothetical protein